MVREKASDGQYVRGDVYFGLNLLLGEIAEEIIDRMMETEAAYVENTILTERQENTRKSKTSSRRRNAFLEN